MMEPPRLRSRAYQSHQSVLRQILAGQFHSSRDQWDVKKIVVPIKSSPPNKVPKSGIPSSPQQQVSHVHDSDAYFTVKNYKYANLPNSV